MANTYSSTPVLSKVKIGTQVYYVKDADVRALLDTYGDVVTYNVEATLSDGNKIPTGAAVTAAINTAVADLTGAMHFEGVKDAVPETVADYASGDIILVGTKEYVCDGTKWVELGDEAIYLTTAEAQSKYVQKTFTIAGIDMQDNITVEEIKTALGLKALAYKDSASVTVNDYANGITGAKYTPEGSVSVTLSQTSTAITSTGSVTAEGTIAGKVTATGSVSIAASNEADAFQVSGTVSTPTITVTPNEDTIQPVASLGKLAKYTAAEYTAPSVNETKAEFASEGLVASIDGEDAEMLVFTAATKANALTSTGFDKGSYTAAKYVDGELPTLGTAKTFVTGIASATSSQPNFVGGKLAATFTGNVAGDAIKEGSFTGSPVSVSVSGNYDKADVKSTGFTGTEATITPTLEKGSKTITVQ